MKSTVIERRKTLLEYIKRFYASKGVYPTYREIADACMYNSLSLLSKDIDSLVDQGELIKNEHKKYQLNSSKEEKSDGYYNFPLLFASSAAKNRESLCEEDRYLLEAQETYLKGQYLKSTEMANELLSRTKNINVKFGCLLTKCCCSLYTGNPAPWKETFLILLGFEPKTQREIMAKELCLYFLSTVLSAKINCPKWLKEGRFYGLTEKALPLAKVTYVSTIIRSEKSISPYLLEPLCSEATAEEIDICQVYMDLYLAIAYHFGGNDEYLHSHVKAAVETCIKNDWLTPLVEMKQPLGTVLDNILIDYDEEYVKRVNALHKTLSEGFNKIYSAIVGDNPTNRLTLREGEIANYVRLGLSNKEIASKLCLSTETIKYYLSSIYSKIGISGRKELRDLMMKD